MTRLAPLAVVALAGGALAQTVTIDPAYRDSYVGAILEDGGDWRPAAGQNRWRLSEDPPRKSHRSRIPLDAPGDPFESRLRDTRGRVFEVPNFNDIYR